MQMKFPTWFAREETTDDEDGEPTPSFSDFFSFSAFSRGDYLGIGPSNSQESALEPSNRTLSTVIDMFDIPFSFSTPAKSKPDDQGTPDTAPSSRPDCSGGGHPRYCAPTSDVAENLTSAMGNKGIDEQQETPEGFHSDRLRLQIAKMPNGKLPDFSLRDTEKEALMREETNFSLLPFGKRMTICSIICAIAAIILAVLARKSLFFVRVARPVEISTQFDLVEYVGLMRMQLCYNATTTGGGSERLLEFNHVRHLANESGQAIVDPALEYGGSHKHQTGCFIQELSTDTIDDSMWNVSRTFLSLAIAFGSFLTAILCLSIYWETINLKPVAIGLLLTYFFQSLSFFFFDSMLCRDHTCKLSEGSIASILASLFWFLSGLCCIRMDVQYQTKKRRWARRKKRAIKKLKLQRKYSTTTEATTFSQDELQPLDEKPPEPEPRNLAFLFDEEAQEVIDLHRWLDCSNPNGGLTTAADDNNSVSSSKTASSYQ